MTETISKHLEAAWSAFGDLLRHVNEEAHEEAIAHATRAALLATNDLAIPDAYGRAFAKTFARSYREAYALAVIENLPS